MDIQYYKSFVNSIKDIMMQMANIKLEPQGDFTIGNDEIISYGFSSIIAYTGKIKGRLLIDMEQSLALAIAKNITGTDYASEREAMVLAAISELNNITAGDSITKLNNGFSLGLRLAPPIVFTGKDIVICVPKIDSLSMEFAALQGKLRLNIAFERGF